MGADLTSTDINKCYITCNKSKLNSTVPESEENNVLPLQEPTHNHNKDALPVAATEMSLLSPPTNKSNSQHLNQSHMKCYYDHIQCHFLDNFNDSILDDAVINAGDIPFQYKIEGAILSL